jgi:hypothetical protein
MAKVKVTINMPAIEAMKRLNSLPVALKVGPPVVKKMLEAIAKGLSPVYGFGRFDEYVGIGRQRRVKKIAKALRKGGAKNKSKAVLSSVGKPYPLSVQYKFPNKKVRPVNLSLNGKMLSHLSARFGNGALQIGIFDKDQALLASYHQDGTDVMPQRRFIPSEKGEDFIETIRRLMKNLYAEQLQKILDLYNKK